LLTTLLVLGTGGKKRYQSTCKYVKLKVKVDSISRDYGLI